MRRILLLFALPLSLFVPCAHAADWARDDALCAQAMGDATLAACARLLASGGLSYRDRAQVYINRGNTYLRTGDYGRAIEDFNLAIRNWPHSPGAYNNRGVVNEVMRQYRQAFEDYSMALSIDPGNEKARKNRTRVAQLIRPLPPQPVLGAPWLGARDPAGALQQSIAQGNGVNIANQQMNQFTSNMMRMRQW